MNKLDRKIEREFEDLFDLFQHPGWETLQEIVEKDTKVLNESIWLEPDSAKLHRMQGHYSVLKFLSTFEQNKRNEYEALTTDEDGIEDEDDDIGELFDGVE